MIKIFIPQVKGKIKTSIRGFWRNEVGKVYYDYLSFKYAICYQEYLIDTLRLKYQQEAIAFIDNEVLKIQDKNCDLKVLNHRIYKEVLRQDLKHSIKEALRVYKGITIYKEGNKYFKEIFY